MRNNTDIGTPAADAPLAGRLVLEVAELFPGPYAGMLLRQLGATVIKVERPGAGDPGRTLIPGMAAAINRGKRSVTLNLKHADGLDLLLRLAAQADVLIAGYRPGVAERLGFGQEAVRALNPQLVYAAISGYGDTGPYRLAPGHDLNYQALAGSLFLSGDPDGPPDYTGALPCADLAAAMYAALAAVAALARRDAAPAGEFLDVSMSDCLTAWTAPRISQYVRNRHDGRSPTAAKDVRYRSAYGVFATRDGKYLSLAAMEDVFWRRLLDLLGLAGTFGAECEHAEERRLHADSVNPRIAACLARETLAFWEDALTRADIPYRAVLDPQDLATDLQVAARGVLNVEADSASASFPIPMRGITAEGTEPMPPPGAHTASVLAGLGCNDTQIQRWREQGVI